MISLQPSSPPSMASNNTTATSPRTPRRPSMSNPMSWLSRSSGAHSHSHSAGPITSHMRISEPQLVNDLFTTTGGPTYTHSRYGPLGTGATVVRTPQDALARAMLIQKTLPYPPHEPPGTTDDDASSYGDADEPASPTSPAPPPVPYASKSSPNLSVLSEVGELLSISEQDKDTMSQRRSKPKRPCPATPESVARPALKPTSPSNVPTLPHYLALTPPQPPFTPILLSAVPDVLLSLSSLIVSIDTSTCSLRTTYATLTSRPSHLADYLQSLARPAYERGRHNFRDTLIEEDEEYEEDDDAHSNSAPDTPFASLFTRHLTSAGLLPQTGGMIHLFLDRPSAPYAHILSYLRSPTENATLPRTASLDHSPHYQSPERMETLLELRDEAKFLGLEELHKLCCDELRQRQGHVRGGGGESNGSSISSSIGSNISSSIGSSGCGQQVIVPSERGRDTTSIHLGSIVRREMPPQGEMDRDSKGSFGHASAKSEVAHVEGVPVSPASSVISRTMSPIVETPVSRSQSRSGSRGSPRSASDWI